MFCCLFCLLCFFVCFFVCCLLQRKHERLGAYNLDEEEELTHYGQSLGDMERFDDIQLSEEEVEEGVCVCEGKVRGDTQDMCMDLFLHRGHW